MSVCRSASVGSSRRTGGALVTANAETRTVSIWRVADGAPRGGADGRSARSVTESAVFSPDGSRVLDVGE
jgi:hypothetical protein